MKIIEPVSRFIQGDMRWASSKVTATRWNGQVNDVNPRPERVILWVKPMEMRRFWVYSIRHPSEDVNWLRQWWYSMAWCDYTEISFRQHFWLVSINSLAIAMLVISILYYFNILSLFHAKIAVLYAKSCWYLSSQSPLCHLTSYEAVKGKTLAFWFSKALTLRWSVKIDVQEVWIASYHRDLR